jgi:tetratricopeptide (TPR) repeat protein
VVYAVQVKDSRSEHTGHNLNARLLRFRSQPGSEDAHALAEDLIVAKRYGDARGVVVSAQPKDHEDGALLVLEGQAWLLEHDMVRAQAALLRAVRAAPELARAYRWLGYVLLKRGDPQRALKTLQRALTLDPHDGEATKLAARAEYLAEAANDSLTSPLDTLPDEPIAERRLATNVSHSARPDTRSLAPRGRQPGGSQQPESRSAAGGDRDEQRNSAPASSRSPKVLRSRPAREVAPVVDPHDDRLEPKTQPQPKPYMANSGAPTPASRGLQKADEEPTSEFRRVPARDTGRPLVEPRPSLRDPSLTARSPAASSRAASGMLTMPMPRRATESSNAAAPASQVSRPAPSAPAMSRPASATRASAVPGSSAQARGAASAGPVDEMSVPLRQRSLASPTAASRTPAPGSTRPAQPPVAASSAAASRTAPPGSARSAQPPIAATPAPGRRVDEAPLQPRGARSFERDYDTQPMPPATQEESSPAIEISEAAFDSAPRPAPDLPTGAELKRPADAEQALRLAQQLGLFEHERSPAAAWSGKHEVTARGTRLRNALIGIWVVTLLLCGGGYYGWQAFVAHRHARAGQLVSDAQKLMLQGDHGALVDAERMLRMAREQHPASVSVPREALLLQVQRVLEDGERDLAALRSAFARARVAKVTGPVLSLATAVLSGFSGEPVARDRALAEVLAAAQADARLLYLVGRFEQRAGRGDALAHLQAAAKAEPKLVPAQLALSELAFDAGDRDAALAQVDAALAIDKGQLRARLFRMFLSADDAEPALAQQALAGLGEAMKKAGAIDRALEALVRARVLRRQGQGEAAGTAVEEAGSAGADDPRLLAWVAREALALGKLTLAQHVASQALSAAPDVAQNRRLLARILIERNDGEHALQLLDKLPADDIEAQIMKAQAALLSSDEAALRAGLDGLTQVQASKHELATQVGALRVRLESKLAPGRAVVDRARALVRSAPGDPEALLALAEAGLAAHDPAIAANALKQRFAVSPDDPNAHYLLGRARRMAADAPGAEASFRRALELAPGHGDALMALAGLLLDQGKYAEADGVFQELATRGGSAVQGRLGRVEALIALGRLDDAQVQLDAVPELQRNTAGYRLTAARAALARSKPGEALTLLRPLVDAQADKVQVMALYGDALYAAEQVDSAAGAYEAALAIDPELPEALLGRADIHLRANRVKDALPLLEKVKQTLSKRIRPPSVQARRLTILGHAYVMRHKRGDLETAREVLREAVKIPGAPADAHFWLGESLGGKVSPEARAAYQRYLELEPHGRNQDRARRAAGPSQ